MSVSPPNPNLDELHIVHGEAERGCSLVDSLYVIRNGVQMMTQQQVKHRGVLAWVAWVWFGGTWYGQAISTRGA